MADFAYHSIMGGSLLVLSLNDLSYVLSLRVFDRYS